MTLFTITFPIQAETADEAWERFKRLVVLSDDELAERSLVEESVGQLYDGDEMTLDEMRARLGVAP